MGSKLKKGVNDLQTLRPDLANEWHTEKNCELTPDNVCAKSSRKVWWQKYVERDGRIFKLEWKASVSNRTTRGSGDPFTSKPPKQILKGFNDLLSTNPDVAALWSHSKNNGVTADDVFASTNKKYCFSHLVEVNGSLICHEWDARPNEVTPGSCPYCTGKKVEKGINDLATTHPSLSGDWDYARNKENGLFIEKVSKGTNKKADWICCVCGHSWRALINNRTTHDSGCPSCARRYHTSFPEQAILYYLNKVFSNCINNDREALNGLELDIFIPEGLRNV